ncbi:MAG: hypothetical protein HY525_18930 [Betaproteobacteria bacterium]|nr:hypothetical protein [Betaproteobacteria bacterium]
MLRKTLLAGAVASTLAVPGAVLAAEPASPHTFAANVGLYSQYIFRGLTQTNRDPAVQGGFDYSYNFGPASFYLGTWLSNIAWLRDGGQYSSSSLENDWYAGVKGNFGASDLSYDIGFLYYYYPGTIIPVAGEKGDTQELYGAVGWKWFAAKYSYSISNKTFAVRDSSGTWYLDLSATVPLGDSGLSLIAHWGDQKYQGTDPRNVGGASNDALYSYQDWKLGAIYDLGKASNVLKGATLGAYYTDTSGANPLGYGSVAEGGVFPRNIADGQFTVYFQKAF